MNTPMSKTLQNTVPSSYSDYPILYINLDDYFEMDEIVSGEILSTIELLDGQQVLLIDNVCNPMVSILARVYRKNSSFEGIVYHFSFYQSDIGVPSFEV